LYPSSLDRVSNSVPDAWIEFQTWSQFFLRLYVFESCRKLRLSLKLDPSIWDRVLNSVPTFCYYIVHPISFSFIFLQPVISSKTSLLLLQELLTENVFLDISIADPYSLLYVSSYFSALCGEFLSYARVVSFSTVWRPFDHMKIRDSFISQWPPVNPTTCTRAALIPRNNRYRSFMCK
jgi:hypothetical protein